MTRMLDTAAAARLAGTTTATVRSWCRHGAVAAVKVHGRWSIALGSLLRRLNGALPRPADRLRRGEKAPVLTGRAARVRVGDHMSQARREAVMGALVDRLNGDRITTAAYLADVLGADAEFVRRYSSPFGRAVAKAYRAKFGVEPRRDGTAWRSRMLVDVFAYDADELPVLEQAARDYSRTALLLAA